MREQGKPEIKQLTNISSCANIYKLKRSGYRGVEQLVARRAHNPEVVGSNPSPATIEKSHLCGSFFICIRSVQQPA